MIELALFTDLRGLEHDPAHARRAPHPESPRRLQALLPAIREFAGARVGDADRPLRVETTRLDDALARVHTAEYLALVEAARGRTLALDPDTGLSPGSVDAAGAAVHTTLAAMDAVLDGEARRAFALVRPPGHHARPSGAMGFCVYANASIAIEHARAHPEIERVMVIDWDVHHGNGTQEIFEDRADVMVCDLHQAGHWPGSGALAERGRGAGIGATLNVPLPPGSDDDDACAAFDAILAPAADRFDPDLVVVCAGFDAHRDDPLGDLCLSAEGFGRLAARARAVADRYAGGRMLLTLEGGYDLPALQASVLATIESLGGGGSRDGAGPTFSTVGPTPRTEPVIRAHSRAPRRAGDERRPPTGHDARPKRA